MSHPNFKKALESLAAAVESLDTAVEDHLDQRHSSTDSEAQVQRVNADRARLASELDRAQAHINHLTEVNREVSQRLVVAMETIRAVLDR